MNIINVLPNHTMKFYTFLTGREDCIGNGEVPTDKEEMEFGKETNATIVQQEKDLGKNESVETGNIFSELCQLTTCNRAEQDLTPNNSGKSKDAAISTSDASCETAHICRGHETANQSQLNYRINQEAPLHETIENNDPRGATSSEDKCRPHQECKSGATLSENMQRENIVNTDSDESTDTDQRLVLRNKSQHFQEAETSNRSEQSQSFQNENYEEPPKLTKLKQGVCKVPNQIECIKTDNENNVKATYETICPGELQDQDLAKTRLSKINLEYANTTKCNVERSDRKTNKAERIKNIIEVPSKFNQGNTTPTDLRDKDASHKKTKKKTKKKHKKETQKSLPTW